MWKKVILPKGDELLILFEAFSFLIKLHYNFKYIRLFYFYTFMTYIFILHAYPLWLYDFDCIDKRLSFD